MKRVRHLPLLVLLDLLVGIGAVFLAIAVRYWLESSPVHREPVVGYIRLLPLAAAAQLLIYWQFGLYRQVLAHASVPEFLRLAWAAGTDSLVTALLVWAVPVTGFPRSIPVIACLFKLAWLGGSRMVLRMQAEGFPQPELTAHPTLVVGAGSAGAMLARELAQHPELGYRLVGFIDDAPEKRGMVLGGKPILGSRSDMAQLVKAHGVTHLIICIPSAGREVIRQYVEAGRGLGLQIKILPGIYELVNGRVTVNQIRDVQIEDLLGRPEVKGDLRSITGFLEAESVLVTGAGGSIGSELCRQIARARPAQLLLLGHGENSIYEIDLELRRLHPDLVTIPIIADVQDKRRIENLFAQHRPGIIFHAAAHKHVPLMEQNPSEAIKNNIFGTLNVARAAHRCGAKRFVLISSDKAVNPTGVMGATKRAAELLVQSMDATSPTIFVGVRFGNVLGSRGSVIPLFKRQIASGGPITITDPRMVRYFMTIPEAVQLVIQAAGSGKGGEVFVLDMGRPIRILDLAHELIRLSGLEPGRDISIIATGIRPGEKLYEELLTAAEGTRSTQHQRIFIAPGRPLPWQHLQRQLTQLWAMAESRRADAHEVRTLIRGMEPSEEAAPQPELGRPKGGLSHGADGTPAPHLPLTAPSHRT